MDTVRYLLGVLLVVGVPPAVLFWILVHPFVAFWRWVGLAASYTMLTVAGVAMGWVAFHFRAPIMGRDLGTSWVLFGVGLVLYLVSAWLSVLTKRHLSMGTFVGIPELARGKGGGVLLQEGIYGVVRHPRYLSVIVGTAGYAMIVNFVGPYLLVLASIPTLLLVIVLEERELKARFGEPYEAYRDRVPALIPRIRR